jgi:hypothetical protein
VASDGNLWLFWPQNGHKICARQKVKGKRIFFATSGRYQSSHASRDSSHAHHADYVLAHLGKQAFLETDSSRRKFFAQFGAKDDALVSANKFGDLMPVSVRRAEKSLTVLFAFIDEGQRSVAKFERFLSTHDKLLCSLPAFEVVYVATTAFQTSQNTIASTFTD